MIDGRRRRKIDAVSVRARETALQGFRSRRPCAQIVSEIKKKTGETISARTLYRFRSEWAAKQEPPFDVQRRKRIIDQISDKASSILHEGFRQFTPPARLCAQIEFATGERLSPRTVARFRVEWAAIQTPPIPGRRRFRLTDALSDKAKSFLVQGFQDRKSCDRMAIHLQELTGDVISSRTLPRLRKEWAANPTEFVSEQIWELLRAFPSGEAASILGGLQKRLVEYPKQRQRYGLFLR
jgi:hypothetical protein